MMQSGLSQYLQCSLRPDHLISVHKGGTLALATAQVGPSHFPYPGNLKMKTLADDLPWVPL